METTNSILVVDDEETIRNVVAEALQEQGYKVQTAANAVEALRVCDQAAFDLALIDMKMPGAMDGLGLLKEIRRKWPYMVVIVLTGYGTLDSAIGALRQGAYDYLAKPASLTQILDSVQKGLEKRREEERRQELITHLEKTLHELKRDGDSSRSMASTAERFIQTAVLTIDRQKRLAVRGEESLALTATEFDLLDYLASHADRVVTASELVKSVHGYELAEPDARPLIRVHIQRLRQKLQDDPDNPRYILNVRGKGYRFVG